MSYSSPIENKKQKYPKIFFERYLSNYGEPEDNISNDSPAELEAGLLENTFFMKRRVRRIAQRLRNRYS